MNFFVFIAALTVICVTSTDGANCGCSTKDYKPIPCINLIGKWYTTLRYDNGAQQVSKCLIYEISLNVAPGAVPRSLIVLATDFDADGKKVSMKGDVTQPNKDLAKFDVKWADSTEMQISMVSSDNENYLIARTCYKLEENVWISTRSTKPSKKVQKLIEAAIVAQKLDKAKLTPSCVGFENDRPPA